MPTLEDALVRTVAAPRAHGAPLAEVATAASAMARQAVEFAETVPPVGGLLTPTQRMHTSGRLGLSRDLPVMITVVDAEDKIRSLLPLIDSMVTEGLVVLSDVDVLKYERRRVGMARTRASGHTGDVGPR